MMRSSVRRTLRTLFKRRCPFTLAAALVLPASLPFPAASVAEPTRFLDPDEAFSVSAVQVPGTGVRITFIAQPGHYLYRDRTSFTTPRTQASVISKVALSDGALTDDPYFGPVSVWRGRGHAVLSLSSFYAPSRTTALHVRYQGCAEAGLCYPPTTKVLDIALPASVPVIAAASHALSAGHGSAPSVTGNAAAWSGWAPRAGFLIGTVVLMLVGWCYRLFAQKPRLFRAGMNARLASPPSD